MSGVDSTPVRSAARLSHTDSMDPCSTGRKRTVVAMAKGWAKKFYNSKAWKDCRAAYISKRTLIDGGMCEKCHEFAGYIVHHKIALTVSNVKDPDIALNPCNLAYECKRCHDMEEGHYLDSIGVSKPYAIFDASGNMIPVDSR